MNEKTVLSVNNLTLVYKTGGSLIPALRDVSIGVAEGRTLGIVGESGSGKSTLAMAIMGYLPRNASITNGEMRLGGRVFTCPLSRAEAKRHREELAMVYQDPAQSLNPVHKIGTQLREVVAIRQSIRGKAATELARQALEDVRIRDIDALLERYPHQISGGQQQRVLIAMALLAKPRLLVLDEPTTGLDATVELEILSLAKDIQQRTGMSMIMISHNLKVVRRVCDDVAVMYGGEIVEAGATADVIATPVHPYTQALLACMPEPPRDRQKRKIFPIPGTYRAHMRDDVPCRFSERCHGFVQGVCDQEKVQLVPVSSQPLRLVRCKRAGEVKNIMNSLVFVEPPFLRQPLVVGRGVSKSFPDRRSPGGVKLANNCLDFDVPEGSVFSIVGESGSGKTTLARILAGLETASGGTLTINGVEVASTRVEHRDPRTRQAVQMVFQNPDESLNPAHSVGYALERAIRKANGGIKREAVQQRRDELLSMVRLDLSFVSKMPRHLSGGQKQRVAIARALAGDVALLLCDEPVSALDVSVQAAIIDLIEEVKQRKNMTVVMVSHDLNLVGYLSDYLIVVNNGEIVERGEVETMYSSPSHPYTRKLLASANQ